VLLNNTAYNNVVSVMLIGLVWFGLSLYNMYIILLFTFTFIEVHVLTNYKWQKKKKNK